MNAQMGSPSDLFHIPSLEDVQDAMQRDSYYKDAAVRMTKQLAHLHGKLEESRADLRRSQARVQEMEGEVIDWMWLAARLGTQTTAERTKRYTLKASVEITRELLGTKPEEVIRHVCVELHKKLLREATA